MTISKRDLLLALGTVAGSALVGRNAAAAEPGLPGRQVLPRRPTMT